MEHYSNGSRTSFSGFYALACMQEPSVPWFQSSPLWHHYHNHTPRIPELQDDSSLWQQWCWRNWPGSCHYTLKSGPGWGAILKCIMHGCHIKGTGITLILTSINAPPWMYTSTALRLLGSCCNERPSYVLRPIIKRTQKILLRVMGWTHSGRGSLRTGSLDITWLKNRSIGESRCIATYWHLYTCIVQVDDREASVITEVPAGNLEGRLKATPCYHSAA